MANFVEIDEGFICEHCKEKVEPLRYSCRDHCPHCLYSKHVDKNPGDRAEECRGLLEPIGIEEKQKGYSILYRCQKCGQIRRNIMAKDDNMKRIIQLSANPILDE